MVVPSSTSAKVLHFSVKKRFGNWIRAVFMKRFYFFYQILLIFGVCMFSKKYKLIGKFSDNLEQNICRLFQIFVGIPFTTSEAKPDYHQKVNVRVAERPKT